MAKQIHDVIVLGCGGVGSAALYQLASRGARVLGLDRFPPGHDRGSSHGQTRVIRLAYFEHPDYVPLLLRAYELWHQLQQAHGSQLYHETGVLGFGPADGALVPNIMRSAAMHGLQVERPDAATVAQRFPGFRVPDNMAAVFEPRAGYLQVEDSIRAQVALARGMGAELRSDVTVKGWSSKGEAVVVDTSAGRFHARHLVVTAGAWAGELLADLGVQFRVLRKHLHWYASDSPLYRQDQGCPVFFLERPEGVFYGFPAADGLGVKISEHSGGEVISNPLQCDRSLDPRDVARVEACLAEHLPEVSRQRTRHEVCMYTMSPDEHFIVGQHPRHPQVAYAAGLSGHGFKFAPVLGELLADLLLQGRSDLPGAFLGPERFAQG